MPRIEHCRTWIALLVAAAASCGVAPDETEQRQVETLSRQEATDTAQSTLIGLTRELAAGLTAQDTELLGNLLDGSFRAVDARSETRQRPVGSSGPRLEELGYLETLSGRLAGRFTGVPDTFKVFTSGNDGTVYAFSGDDAIRVRWKRQPSGWQATHVIFLSAASARDMIARTG